MLTRYTYYKDVIIDVKLFFFYSKVVESNVVPIWKRNCDKATRSGILGLDINQNDVSKATIFLIKFL